MDKIITCIECDNEINIRISGCKFEELKMWCGECKDLIILHFYGHQGEGDIGIKQGFGEIKGYYDMFNDD